jgi:hypothetical protein
MIVYDSASSLCVAVRTGFEDGPMLHLCLGHAAQVDDKGVQIVLRTVS